MSAITADLDLKRCGSLLAKTAPKVIKTEAENDRQRRHFVSKACSTLCQTIRRRTSGQRRYWVRRR